MTKASNDHQYPSKPQSLRFANGKLPNNAVICLMAPTASGKTSLAYELYDTGRFEIVSIDSALIYCDMNIGTAKPTEEELHRYPHHMVNIVDPTETYSVASFVNEVAAIIEHIHARQKIPLLVGGTMMYYMAMFSGLSPVPETDVNIRQDVEAWRQQSGNEALHDYLKKVDPEIAERLNVSDTQRITRAVEVYKQTQKPLSAWQKLPKRAIADNPEQFWLGLAVIPDRAWLHDRIEQRLQLMWQAGFVDEVLGLLTRYPSSVKTPAMRCVGYRQVLNYLIAINHPVLNQDPIIQEQLNLSDLKISQKTRTKLEKVTNEAQVCDPEVAHQDMKDKALYATRQLAKRQCTWLRNIVNTFARDTVQEGLTQSQTHDAHAKTDVKHTPFNDTNLKGGKVGKEASASIHVYPFTTMQDARAFLTTYL